MKKHSSYFTKAGKQGMRENTTIKVGQNRSGGSVVPFPVAACHSGSASWRNTVPGPDTSRRFGAQAERFLLKGQNPWIPSHPEDRRG